MAPTVGVVVLWFLARHWTALCLEPHDLWISKAVAGRPKDREFCRAMTERNLVKAKILLQRLEMTAGLNPAIRKLVCGFIENA